ncbi:unnamed protein product [Euphydryas editha]|uniref:HTH psq-type domain-containing protein n=1 Tax=Euphydryas editha TaxID=104508 RepID=A0AAU9TSN3_EUPED|nr:unnamed protein product [Euphydryas editha]
MRLNVSRPRTPVGGVLAAKRTCWERIFVFHQSKMPQKRIKTTDCGSKDVLLYQEAYKEILQGRTIRAAAKMFDLCHVSLMRYKQKKEANPDGIASMVYNLATKF